MACSYCKLCNPGKEQTATHCSLEKNSLCHPWVARLRDISKPSSGSWWSPDGWAAALSSGRLYTAAGLWVQAVAELVWQPQANALGEGQMRCMLSAACR